MDDWLTLALRAPAVLVTVAIAEGSVPREPGAKMLVTRDGFAGTIGGGHLEHRAIAMARTMLEEGKSRGGAPRLERFALGPSLGQCCGGVAHLAFECVHRDQIALLDARRTVDTTRVLALDLGWAASPLTLSTGGGVAATTQQEAISDRADENGVANAQPSLERASGRAAHPMGMLSPSGERHAWALFDAVGNQLAGAAVPVFDRSAGTHVMTDPTGRRWLIDPILAPRAHLMLFGAGHVGAAIVRALAELPCRVSWVDERDDLFPPVIPANVTVEATDTPEALVEAAPPGTTFLVMTHSHALDLRLSIAILSRPGQSYAEADWFGLIGSSTKRRQFEHRLRERGIAGDRIAAMVCPIGLPGIGGKAPAVIAASCAAQLLTVWESAAMSADIGSGIGLRRGAPNPLQVSSESN